MLTDDPWSQALSLLERRKINYDQRALFNTEHAESLVSNWKTHSFFKSNDLFQRRLKADSIRQEEFMALLALETIYLPTPLPKWRLTLDDVLRQQPISGTGPRGADSEALEPFLSYAKQKLEFLFHVNREEVFGGLSDDLQSRLQDLCTPVLFSELHAGKTARDFETPNSSVAQPDTVNWLSERGGLEAVLKKYPVLGRLLAEETNRWVDTVHELIVRLKNDSRDLRCFGFDCNLSKLRNVVGGLSDPHRGGRTVWRLDFGDGCYLIYKPKSLAVDLHFYGFLGWINGHCSELDFRQLRIVNRGDYGWSEYVSAADCQDKNEVHSYYRRLGGLMALLLLLGATDIHRENLVAHGEFPVVIDLECLFHNSPGKSADDMSVLDLGLLPMWLGNARGTIDLSGMFGLPGQLSPFKSPTWVATETGKLRREDAQLRLEGDDHLPKIKGTPANPNNFVEDLIEGFEHVSRTLLNFKEELTEVNGPVNRFAYDPVRFIARATYTYQLLLRGATHPKALRTGLDHDRAIDRLWLGVINTTHIDCLFPSERDDLWNLDIPYFRSFPASRNLWDSQGRVFVDFFEKTALESTLERINRLDSGQISRQLFLLESAMHLVNSIPVKGPNQNPPLRRVEIMDQVGTESDSEPMGKHLLLQAAEKIGDMLAQSSFRGQRGVEWVTLWQEGSNRWYLNIAPARLYDGNAGIALFLCYLGSCSGKLSYQELALDALSAAEKSQIQETNIFGAFTGKLSVLYARSHIASLLKDQHMIQSVLISALRLGMEVSHCSEFDISGGLAGYLLVMLGLYHQCGEREALNAAIVAGDELVKRASELGNGIGWYSPNTRTFLSGFAHGAAGVCYALCELAKFSSEERFVRAAAKALAFIESQRFPAEEDWPFVRLRPSGREERKLITGWCHGAPGIGLAYLAAWKLGVIGADKGLEQSLRITRMRGFESNHSLCHGNAGNAELLIEAGIALGQPALLNEALIRGKSMVQDMNSEAGLRSGSHVGIMVPDLMLGLAGIGYGFLRILNQVPSILTLRPGTKWD